MADQTNGLAAPTAPPPGDKTSQFRVLAQYIKDMSFENPNAPGALQTLNERPKLKIDANVAARKMGDNVYESALTFEASSTGPGDVAHYHIEITYAGLFRIEGVPDNAIQPILLINCPTLLYPFMRRLVADLTREGGYPPLLLDPIDFHGLYLRNSSKLAGQPQAAIA